MLLRCVYVSSASLDVRHADAQLQQIVDHATTANNAARITGALMFDGSRFAQLIEGPAPEIARLAERLALDRRHKDIVFLERKCVAEQLFDGFCMAYCGRSVFVRRSIALPLTDRGEKSEFAVQQLIQLMVEFAR